MGGKKTGYAGISRINERIQGTINSTMANQVCLGCGKKLDMLVVGRSTGKPGYAPNDQSKNWICSKKLIRGAPQKDLKLDMDIGSKLSEMSTIFGGLQGGIS